MTKSKGIKFVRLTYLITLFSLVASDSEDLFSGRVVYTKFTAEERVYSIQAKLTANLVERSGGSGDQINVQFSTSSHNYCIVFSSMTSIAFPKRLNRNPLLDKINITVVH